MRPGKICILLTCLLLISVSGFAAGNTAYKVSPQIPLDSWTYPALDRVVALCYVKNSLAGTKPLTRLEAARLTGIATVNARLYAVPPQVKRVLSRLQTELRPELEYLADASGTLTAAPTMLLRSAQASYTYRDGKNSAARGTNASQFALNYNNAGQEYDNHHNGAFSLLGDTILFDQLLLTWQPQLSQKDDDGSSYDTLLATAAVSFYGIELSVGRQSLWWGPGQHGSLILTNNTQPLDMLRLTNPSPLQLPWLFKYLGPFHFDLFASRLDDNRAVPEPYFGGLRLNFKPAYWLELGATRTVMFGGDGRPSVDASDFLTILGGNNLSGNEDTSNSVAGIDVRISFPLLWGAQLYGELVGEDEAGGFFSRNSYMVGAFLPQIETSGRLSLRVEYADTTRIGAEGSVLYRHGIYTSGYTYEEQIMGHHVGTDATDLSLKLGIDCTDNLSLALGVVFEERGKSLDTQEKHTQFDLEATWWLNSRVAVSGRYAYDDVENLNFTGDDEVHHLATFGGTYSW